MLWVNSIAWFFYGLYVQNYYVACPNLVGAQFMLYYLLLTYHLHSDSQRVTLRYILLIGKFCCLAVAIVAFLSIQDRGQAQVLLGIAAVIALVVFYSSPLSNLVKVIKSKDARSIHPGLAVASAINGLLWTCYGFAVKDMFIALPNFLGILSALVQLVLLYIFKGTYSRKSEDEVVVDDQESGNSSPLEVIYSNRGFEEPN
jgi:solute carrier family 50 protein (sugar transporter)